MSDTLKLGQIIEPEREAQRDATHIAVAPCIAGEKLSPGEHAGIRSDGTAMGDHATAPAIGVVDPFLKRPVKSGERFWLYLYPGTITALRHEWSHPAFKNADAAAPVSSPRGSESEQWLRDYAVRMDADYDEMIAVAETHCEGAKNAWHDYLIDGGKWEGDHVPDEFWTHYAALTGKKGSGNIFSCSC